MARDLTRTPFAQSTAQRQADAAKMNEIVARAMGGVPHPDDRAALLAIARRMPEPTKTALRPVLASLGETI